ncbi:MAG: Periplasmic protein TonB-like protein [Chlamydiales bacterium]|jgi:hypothetical protein|nr:Periplasmic protein TonB-like protein [Chlamydiales bacterium]
MTNIASSQPVQSVVQMPFTQNQRHDSPTSSERETIDERSVSQSNEASHNYDRFNNNLQVTGKKVLLISSQLKEANKFAQSVQDDVLEIEYNYEKDSLEEILQKVKDRLGSEQAASIGFVNHGTTGYFQLIANKIVDNEKIKTDHDLRKFWRQLGKLVHGKGRIDLLACSLASSQNGKKLIDRLETLTGINFAASTNLTGNSKGANWILETDNVDVGSLYFKASKLADIQEDLIITTPSYPSVATVNSNNPWLDGVNDYIEIPSTMLGGATNELTIQFDVVFANPHFYYSALGAPFYTYAEAGDPNANPWFTVFDFGCSSSNNNIRLEIQRYDTNNTQFRITVGSTVYTYIGSIPSWNNQTAQRIVLAFANTSSPQSRLRILATQPDGTSNSAIVNIPPAYNMRVDPAPRKMLIGRNIDDTNPQYTQMRIDNLKIWNNYDNTTAPDLHYAWDTTRSSPIFRNVLTGQDDTLHKPHSEIELDSQLFVVNSYGALDSNSNPIGVILQNICKELNTLKESYLFRPTLRKVNPITGQEDLVIDTNEVIYQNAKAIAIKLRYIAQRLGAYILNDYPANTGARTELTKIQALINKNIPTFASDITAAADMQALEKFFAPSRDRPYSLYVDSIFQYIKNFTNILKNTSATSINLSPYVSYAPFKVFPEIFNIAESTMKVKIKKLGDSVDANKRAIAALNRLQKILNQKWRTNERGELCADLKTPSSNPSNSYSRLGGSRFNIEGNGGANVSTFFGTGNTFSHFGLIAAAEMQFSMPTWTGSIPQFSNTDVKKLINCLPEIKNAYAELTELAHSDFLSSDIKSIINNIISTHLKKAIDNTSTTHYMPSDPDSSLNYIGEILFRYPAAASTSIGANDSCIVLWETDKNDQLVANSSTSTGLTPAIYGFNVNKDNVANVSDCLNYYRSYYALVRWWEGRDPSPYQNASSVQNPNAGNLLTDLNPRKLVSDAINSLQSINENYQQELKTSMRQYQELLQLVGSLMNKLFGIYQKLQAKTGA